jgi:hypothetical protein
VRRIPNIEAEAANSFLCNSHHHEGEIILGGVHPRESRLPPSCGAAELGSRMVRMRGQSLPDAIGAYQEDVARLQCDWTGRITRLLREEIEM